MGVITWRPQRAPCLKAERRLRAPKLIPVKVSSSLSSPADARRLFDRKAEDTLKAAAASLVPSSAQIPTAL
jgi:hypothetical protein